MKFIEQEEIIEKYLKQNNNFLENFMNIEYKYQQIEYAVTPVNIVDVLPNNNLKFTLSSDSYFEMQKIDDILQLPIIQYDVHDSMGINPIIESYTLKKYQLHDTKYTPTNNHLQQLEYNLVYRMQPPKNVFQQKHITIKNYELFSQKQFIINLINPSQVYKICITQIFIDSMYINITTKRSYPICLDAGTKYPFKFLLYINQYRSHLIRVSINFIISVWHDKLLVDDKIWSKMIIIKTLPNHLAVNRVIITKNNTVVSLRNTLQHEIMVFLNDNNFMNNQTQLCNINGLKLQPSQQKQINIHPKEHTITIHTKSLDNILQATLYVPVVHQSNLKLNSFNIGILNKDSTQLKVPITANNNIQNLIYIEQIEVKSTTQTVELKRSSPDVIQVPAESKKFIIFHLIIHHSKLSVDRTQINIIVTYKTISISGQFMKYKTSLRLFYAEMKSPISVGNHRFIDVTKFTPQQKQKGFHGRLPIRNNLNLPLTLARIAFDETMFSISYLRDQRDFIYPNQQKQQFSFTYIGPKKLKVSPYRSIIVLQFNGYLFIPLQIVIYDHSFQCMQNLIISKCSRNTSIDLGYFRETKAIKNRQLRIRNWNPENKHVTLKLNPSLYIIQYGVKITMNISGPYPNYDLTLKKSNSKSSFYLKGNHQIIINITIQLLSNASTGSIPLIMKTSDQVIKKLIIFKIEEGTIAIIPQLTRINNQYTTTIQHVNLVSTFSESYWIRSILTNHSTVIIYCNKDSQIFENQWIGMTIIHDPYRHEHNVTLQCCGEDYLYGQYLQTLLKNETEQQNNELIIQAVLKTTNDLEVTSTIIINQNVRNLLNIGKSGNNRQLNVIVMNSSSEITVEIQIYNSFQNPLKYSVYMLPIYFQNWAAQYIKYYEGEASRKVAMCFCVNNTLRNKHRLTPLLLKEMFRLNFQPQEVTIEPIDHNYYYIQTQSTDREYKFQKIDLPSYIVNTVSMGARMCYNMTLPKYFKDLIQTEIINDIAQLYDTEKLRNFIIRQFYNYNNHQIELKFDQFYSKINLQLRKYCHKASFPIFAFCKHIDLQILQTKQIQSINVQQLSQNNMNRQFVNKPKLRDRFKQNATVGNNHALLDSGKVSVIRLKLMKSMICNYSFNLVVANNYTKFQSYQIRLLVSHPRIIIRYIFIGNLRINKNQFQLNNFQHNIKKIEQSHKLINRASILPLVIVMKSFEQVVSISHYRTFELYNEGQVSINITHIGFQSIYKTCKWDKYRVINAGCELEDKGGTGFIIYPQQSMNLTIEVKIPNNTDKYSFIDHADLYLYYKDNYYCKMVIIAQVGVTNPKTTNKNTNQVQMPYWIYILNITSFGFICLIICIYREEDSSHFCKNKLNKKIFENFFKDQTDETIKIDKDHKNMQKKNLYDQKKKNCRIKSQRYVKSFQDTRLMPLQYYDIALGTRIQNNKMDNNYKLAANITNQMINLLKEYQRKEPLVYFNEFQESILKKSTNQDSNNLSISGSIQGEGIMSKQNTSFDVDDSSIEICNQNENSQSQDQNQSDSSDSYKMPVGIQVHLRDDDFSCLNVFGFGMNQTCQVSQTVLKRKQNDYYDLFSTENPLKKSMNPYNSNQILNYQQKKNSKK